MFVSGPVPPLVSRSGSSQQIIFGFNGGRVGRLFPPHFGYPQSGQQSGDGSEPQTTRLFSRECKWPQKNALDPLDQERQDSALGEQRNQDT